jgi:RimJ/RimL family protein N-acetyltransferase
MNRPPPEHHMGLDALDVATTLLRRIRRAHPTKGLFETGDLQWRWRSPRSTDSVPQLFWFDELGQPEAAVVLTDWNGTIALDPIVLPNASADWVAHVIDRGLVHAAEIGVASVELEVDREDVATRSALLSRSFAQAAEGLVETWLEADDRPDITPLGHGYRLGDRLGTAARAHHMIRRSGPDVDARLRQTSLYRPDLDLVVLDADDQPAAYGLFWFDPETRSGLVEPMRTEDAHQRRGLARHVLTAGVDRLVRAGATRIKICYEPANPASGHLYRSAGFQPTGRTDVFAGPTTRP